VSGAQPPAAPAHSAAEQRLVNDIARQFHHLPPAQAATAIAGHVSRFWDPRMRAALFALVDAGASGLDPLAVSAAELIRAP
jgi:formate dehydrogenase subunit delta